MEFEDIARGPVLSLRRKILNELHGFPSFRRGWGVVPGAPAHTTHFENYGNHKILVIIGGGGGPNTPHQHRQLWQSTSKELLIEELRRATSRTTSQQGTMAPKTHAKKHGQFDKRCTWRA